MPHFFLIGCSASECISMDATQTAIGTGMVRNDYLEILNGFYFKQLGQNNQLNVVQTQKFVLNTIYCGVGKMIQYYISGWIEMNQTEAEIKHRQVYLI